MLTINNIEIEFEANSLDTLITDNIYNNNNLIETIRVDTKDNSVSEIF